jgi:hypothetical protein
MDEKDLIPDLAFRVKENSWIARMAALRLNVNKVAIVIGHTIHLHNTTQQDFLHNKKWLKHELCHVRQYQRYGIAGFIMRYLWESIRKGYRNNRFEAEARLAEES